MVKMSQIMCYIFIFTTSAYCDNGSGLLLEENDDNFTAYTVEVQPSTSDVIPDIYPSIATENEQPPTPSLLLTKSDEFSAVSSGPYMTTNGLESLTLISYTSTSAISSSGVATVSLKTALLPTITTSEVITMPSTLSPSLHFIQSSVMSTGNVVPSVAMTSETSEVRNSGTTQTFSVIIPTGALAGIVLALTITVVALSMSLVLLVFLCYCCFKSKQYAHTAGAENRMAIQPWHMNNMMSRSFSVSSFGSGRSRGSFGSGWSRRSGSLFGSLSSLRHHSDSKDQVTSIINQSIPDLYSTPL